MNHFKNVKIIITSLAIGLLINTYLTINALDNDTYYAQPNETSMLIRNANHNSSHKKTWTIVIYMAAHNDLRSFAARNIKQMGAIGSNKYINIVVHLDILIANNKKITRRYWIKQNEVIHVNAYDESSQQMDSGQPETLISACKWAINDYPAENYALIFWNHGTGELDPQQGRILNATELFTYNPELRLLELDRSSSILGNTDHITHFQDPQNLLWLLEKDENTSSCAAIDADLQTDDPRGICWDDSSGNYLTNQKLDYALQTVRTQYLQNKKFAIIGFDACLMSMIGVGSLIKKHADIMVGSQEVELGTGWNYQKVLDPFLTRNLTKIEFAQHIVRVYEETYNKITNDYTQSAINLNAFQPLEDTIDSLAELLINALLLQKNKSVYNALHASKNKLLCTHFDEPSYIDLHHFLANLEQNLKHFSFTNAAQGQIILADLRKNITQAKTAVKKVVLANVCGKNLAQAQGLSIYFPENRIHSSYPNTLFARQNSWFKLLQTYIIS